MSKYLETRTRAVVKAITWRITATLDTMVIVFFFTQDFSKALGIGFIEVITKGVIYYIHERAWNKSRFGRIYENDDMNYQI